jgi:bifunctional DNA-binding transcriptional regulator/antitoxin component of YhaV-PrlF toxin-antitoxin module
MNTQEFSDEVLKQVESAKKFSVIIAKAWEDDSFKQHLFAEPKAILNEYGIEVPDTLRITVVENSVNLLYVSLPAKPSIEPSKEQLKIVQEYSEQFPQQTDYDKKYYQIVAKAWKDDSFKQRLLSEPKVIFKEYGIEVADNLEIQVVQNTSNSVYFIIPVKPSEELSEQELEIVAGGLEAAEGALGLLGLGVGLLALVPAMPVAAGVAIGAAVISAGVAVYEAINN